MESWKGMLIAFGIVALFGYCLLNFVYLMQINNNVNSTILSGNSPLNSLNSSISNSLGSLSSTAINYKNASESDQSSAQNPQGALTLNSILRSGLTFSTFIFGFAGSLVGSVSYLGIDPVIFTTIMAILIAIFVLLWWRLVKWGQ